MWFAPARPFAALITATRHAKMHRDLSKQSLLLPGGKSASNNQFWTPGVDAVRATIPFAMATGRFDAQQPVGEAY